MVVETVEGQLQYRLHMEPFSIQVVSMNRFTVNFVYVSYDETKKHIYDTGSHVRLCKHMCDLCFNFPVGWGLIASSYILIREPKFAIL